MGGLGKFCAVFNSTAGSMVQDAHGGNGPSLWNRPGVRGGGAFLELASSKVVSVSVFVPVLRRSDGQRMVWRHCAWALRGFALHRGRGLLFRSSVSLLRRERNGHRVLHGICRLHPGGELGEFIEKE